MAKKKKKDPVPTKNFRFGVKRPTKKFKFEGYDLVMDQIVKGHRYRNKLVELELKRRNDGAAALREHSPRMVQLDELIAAADQRVEQSRKAVQDYKIATRKRRVPAELRDAASKAVAERRGLYAEQKRLKAKLYGPPLTEDQLDNLDKQLKAACKVLQQTYANIRKEKPGKWSLPKTPAQFTAFLKPYLRGLGLTPLTQALKRIDVECYLANLQAYHENGLFWPTTCAILDAARSFRKGPPPKFLSWRGDGRIAMQLQTQSPKLDAAGKEVKPGKQLTWAQAMQGNDNRLRILPTDPAEFQHPAYPGRDGRRQRQRRKVFFRIGSQGRDPIWAVLPTIIHRDDIPPHAVVKWIYLHRRMVAEREQWTLTCTLAMQGGFPLPQNLSAGGAVGIDLGWRVLPDRNLRGGYWQGHDGNYGEIALPEAILAQFNTCDRIAGHRTDIFNLVQTWLLEFLDKHRPSEELAKELHRLADWRSKRRLSHVVRRWRKDASVKAYFLKAITGDQQAWLREESRDLVAKGYLTLPRGIIDVGWLFDFWLRREDHLFAYETNLRQQLAARRLDHYRNLAADLRRRYRTVRMEGERPAKPGDPITKGMDLTKFGRKESPELEAMQEQEQRRIARLVAPGELRQCLVNSGMQVEWIDPAYTTSDCPNCGQRNEFNRRGLYFTCSRCNAVHDQDRAAARNLLNGGVLSGNTEEAA